MPAGSTVVRAVMAAAGAVALLLVGYHLMAEALVSREVRKARRDPETGVLLGARERDLGPADSPGAVLFVHGFVGAGDNFGALPEAVAAAGWRVRVMRLPGHGTSPRDYARQTPESLLAGVRDELGALRSRHRTVVVVGHSMGAALSVLAISRDGADGLVLGAPYFGVTRRWYYLLPPEAWTRILSPFVRWVYKGKVFMMVNREAAKDEITTYGWVPARGILTMQEIGRRARRPEVLARIRCPVLMVHSRRDAAASPRRAEAAFEALGSEAKRIVWLERSNHMIFVDWDRDEISWEVLGFLGAPGEPAFLQTEEGR